MLLAVMNGGHADYDRLERRPKFLEEFKTECVTICSRLVALNFQQFAESRQARISKGKDYNHEAAFVNRLLCDMENRILTVIINFFKARGFITDNCVLCFDGVLIPKNAGMDLAALLPECSAAIKAALGSPATKMRASSVSPTTTTLPTKMSIPTASTSGSETRLCTSPGAVTP